MSEIDPVNFGRLVQSVESLKAEVAELHRDVKQLRSLADRGRGAFLFAGLLWGSVGVLIASAWQWVKGPH